MEKLWLKHYPKGVPYEIPPLDQSLTQRFEKACREFNKQPAFISFGKSLSYSELWQFSCDFARFLRAKDLRPGDRIALQLPNILAWPVSLWGAWLAGLTVVPLSFVSPLAEILLPIRQSHARAIVLLSPSQALVKKLLSKTHLKLVISAGPGDLLGFPKRAVLNLAFRLRQGRLWPNSLAQARPFHQALKQGAKQASAKSPNIEDGDNQLKQASAKTPNMEDGDNQLKQASAKSPNIEDSDNQAKQVPSTFPGDSDNWPKQVSSKPPNIENSDNQLKQAPANLPNFEKSVLIPWTGGATGKSKAVLLSQKNLLSNIKQCELWMRGALKRGEEKALCALPLSHSFALMLNGLVFCLNGYSNVLIADPRKIASLVRVLRKTRPTVGIGVDRLFKALLKSRKFRSLDFSSWKIFIAGGIALSPDTQKLWQEITKSRLLEGYGLTEASPVVTCPRLDRDHQGTAGLPLPGTEVRILDEKGKELCADQEGELAVRGPQVMKGYLESSAKASKTGAEGISQARFTHNPRAKEGVGSAAFDPEGWLKTGDMARLTKEGFVQILGRKKEMINVSGFKLYPAELEQSLMSYEKVSDTAVVSVTDSQGREAIKAFVVPCQGGCSINELQGWCKKNMAFYKIPKQIEFVQKIPKNPMGKPLREQLKEY